jgi:hypothetical protein
MNKRKTQMSVIADYQVSGLFPSTVGGTGSAVEKYFPRLLGNAIGAVPLTPSATSSAGQLVVPGMSVLNGQLFKVKAAGNVLSFTGGTTYVISLWANTALPGATAAYFLLGNTTAIGVAGTVPVQWAFDMSLQGDSASGNVSGFYTCVVNGVLIRNNVLTATLLTGINFNGITPAGLSTASGGPGSGGGSATPFGIVASVNFASSVAGNSAKLFQLQVIAD